MKMVKKNKYLLIAFLILVLVGTLVFFYFYNVKRSGIKDEGLYTKQSPSPSPSPNVNIISMTYKAKKICPDGFAKKIKRIILQTDSAGSIYAPGSEILKKDDDDVNSAKKSMNPVKNLVNNGNLLAGVSQKDRLSDINAVSAQSGTNLNAAVSNNDALTKKYSDAQSKLSRDNTTSYFVNNNKTLTDTYFTATIGIQSRYISICELIDSYLYKLLNNLEREILKQQYDESTTFKEGFGLTQMDAEKACDELINQIKNTQDAWSMWQTFYVNGSKFLLDFSGSALPENWDSQSSSFASSYSKWMDFETTVSNNIYGEYVNFTNEKSMDPVKNVIKILYDASIDKSFDTLKTSFKNFSTLPKNLSSPRGM